MTESIFDLRGAQVWVKSFQAQIGQNFASFQQRIQEWMQRNGYFRNVVLSAAALTSTLGVTKAIDFFLHSTRAYRISTHEFWDGRTFPQLIETIKTIRNVMIKHGDPVQMVEKAERIYDQVRVFEYKNMPIIIDLSMKRMLLYRIWGLLKKTARKVRDATGTRAHEQEPYRGFMIDMKKITEPQMGWEHDMLGNGGQLFRPEMIILSLRDTPENAIGEMVNRIQRRNEMDVAEKIFLLSRPEQAYRAVSQQVTTPHGSNSPFREIYQRLSRQGRYEQGDYDILL